MQRSVLSIIQTDESIRSSDEFEKPPRPPIRKSVSAGMLRKNKGARGSLKHKSDEEDNDSKKSERNRNSKSGLKNKIDEDNVEADEVYSRKLRKRSSRFDLKKILALENEAEEEVPRKTRPLRKKPSKTDLKQIDTSNEENDIIPKKRINKKSSQTNLNETFTSEENEKSSLNETFTSQEESMDLTDAGLKKKRKLFNAKESFFNPVEFENADL